MNTKESLPVIRFQIADIELPKRNLSLYAHLDKRRPNKKGTFPIRIRITYNRSHRDYGTKQYATENQFKQIAGKRPKGAEADIKINVISLLERAYHIIQSLTPFSFSSFNESYLNKKNNDLKDIFNWYDDKIKQLGKNDQVGTAASYKCSKLSLKEYVGKDVLLFNDVDENFLKKYENWMLSKNKSSSTIGIYLRPLRHIFNLAIDHQSDLIESYPFKKYKIPSPKNIKKSLVKAEIKAIYEYNTEKGSPEAFYKDIWLFSYFANGINMKDICRLKYGDMKGDTIEFRRAKTMRTKKNVKPICITITGDVRRIIEEYGTTPKISKNYIFDFLKPDMNAMQERIIIQNVTRKVNKYIKRITKELKIEKNVSTYSARHSFATILKNAGVAPSFIGESLGHSSLSTTESYLGSFEDDQRKVNIDKLKDW